MALFSNLSVNQPETDKPAGLLVRSAAVDLRATHCFPWPCRSACGGLNEERTAVVIPFYGLRGWALAGDRPGKKNKKTIDKSNQWV
jgi:hypothetical protein